MTAVQTGAGVGCPLRGLKRLACMVAAAVLFAACGGGGGEGGAGGGDNIPSDQPSLVLTEANAKAAVANARMTVAVMLDAGPLAALHQKRASAEETRSAGDVVQSGLPNVLRALLMPRPQDGGSATKAYSDTPPASCPNDVPVVPKVGDRISLTFTECSSGSSIVNGSIAIEFGRAVGDSSSAEELEFWVTLSNFRIKTSGWTITANGDLQMSFPGSASEQFFAGRHLALEVSYLGKRYMTTLMDYRAREGRSGPGSYALEAFVETDDAQLGDWPLAYRLSTDWRSPGEFRLAGHHSGLVMNSTGHGGFEIHLDPTGQGVYPTKLTTSKFELERLALPLPTPLVVNPDNAMAVLNNAWKNASNPEDTVGSTLALVKWLMGQNIAQGPWDHPCTTAGKVAGEGQLKWVAGTVFSLDAQGCQLEPGGPTLFGRISGQVGPLTYERTDAMSHELIIQLDHFTIAIDQAGFALDGDIRLVQSGGTSDGTRWVRAEVSGSRMDFATIPDMGAGRLRFDKRFNDYHFAELADDTGATSSMQNAVVETFDPRMADVLVTYVLSLQYQQDASDLSGEVRVVGDKSAVVMERLGDKATMLLYGANLDGAPLQTQDISEEDLDGAFAQKVEDLAGVASVMSVDAPRNVERMAAESMNILWILIGTNPVTAGTHACVNSTGTWTFSGADWTGLKFTFGTVKTLTVQFHDCNFPHNWFGAYTNTLNGTFEVTVLDANLTEWPIGQYGFVLNFDDFHIQSEFGLETISGDLRIETNVNQPAWTVMTGTHLAQTWDGDKTTLEGFHFETSEDTIHVKQATIETDDWSGGRTMRYQLSSTKPLVDLDSGQLEVLQDKLKLIISWDSEVDYDVQADRGNDGVIDKTFTFPWP